MVSQEASSTCRAKIAREDAASLTQRPPDRWACLLIAAPIVRGNTGLLVGRLGQAGGKGGPLILVPLSSLQEANCAAIF
jgi:hypothetical protein